MLALNIPGYGNLEIHHVVLDFNGTIAFDGQLLPGIEGLLRSLAEHVTIHVLTADTFGSAAAQLEGLPVRLAIIPSGDQSEAKAAVVTGLRPITVVAVGNGRNDHLMLELAALGIAIVGPEGAALRALQAADLIVTSPQSALEMLLNPKRLSATLRS